MKEKKSYIIKESTRAINRTTANEVYSNGMPMMGDQQL